MLAYYVGNHADAERMSREALDLARQSGDKATLASALYARGAANMDSDLRETWTCFQEALTLFQQLGDPWGVARTINSIGEATRLEGDYESANQLYQQALTRFREIGNPGGRMSPCKTSPLSPSTRVTLTLPGRCLPKG